MLKYAAIKPPLQRLLFHLGQFFKALLAFSDDQRRHQLQSQRIAAERFRRFG